MFKNFDWIIVVCVLVLAGFSLTVIFSIFPGLFLAQLIFFIFSFLVFFFFSQIDHRLYQALWLPIYFVSCILLLVIFVVGIESRGAIRWIEIGNFRLQFSELLKPFFITSLAAVLIQFPPKNLKNFLFSCSFFLVPFFLVFRQPDLGSAIVYILSFGGLVFVSGISLSYILASIFIILSSAPLLWNFLKDYQKTRLLSFFNPGQDPLGSSYNAIQAVIAVGSGMIFGKGLGRGTQSHLNFLPERHTDFIFASLAEEFGYVGVLLILVTYFIIFLRIFKLIQMSSDKYTILLLTGFLFILLSQFFINIGMNIGLLPITGITLPLISYGGSSILATMIMLGIIESIAKEQRLR
ncbi:MAG: rod shape-determining protein RodA [Patescibacteria group bacterium]